MYDGTTDQLCVSFPATTAFTRIGRVTVAGLALRLGIDVTFVENLRVAVDLATASLVGQGTTKLAASWEPGHLAIDVENTEATISSDDAQALREQLIALVTEVIVQPHHVGFAIEDLSVTDDQAC